MKHKLTRNTGKRTIGLLLAVVMGLSGSVMLSSCGKKAKKPVGSEASVASSETEVSSQTIEVDKSESSGESEETTTETNPVPKEEVEKETRETDKAIKTSETAESKEPASKTTATASTDTVTSDKQTTASKPIETVKKAEEKKYACGSNRHRCKTPEDHNFLVSLEEKGCPICGSHSCNSFYASDEWGNPCYDITQCPEYTKEEDPAVTCEHCGRKSGLGDEGTCVRFTVDTICPICGKAVPAKTCHTHG